MHPTYHFSRLLILRCVSAFPLSGVELSKESFRSQLEQGSSLYDLQDKCKHFATFAIRNHQISVWNSRHQFNPQSQIPGLLLHHSGPNLAEGIFTLRCYLQILGKRKENCFPPFVQISLF